VEPRRASRRHDDSNASRDRIGANCATYDSTSRRWLGALPEERLGELSAANPEESGHLGIELAGCIDDPQRRRGERRGCNLENHGSSIEWPGERRPTAG
jgi:hypothetical protein